LSDRSRSDLPEPVRDAALSAIAPDAVIAPILTSLSPGMFFWLSVGIALGAVVRAPHGVAAGGGGDGVASPLWNTAPGRRSVSAARAR